MRAYILIGIGILLLAMLDKIGEILKGMFLPSYVGFILFFIIFIALGKGTTELIKFKRKGLTGVLISLGVGFVIVFSSFFTYTAYFNSGSFVGPSIISVFIILIIYNIIRYQRANHKKIIQNNESDDNYINTLNETKISQKQEDIPIISLVREAETDLRNAIIQGVRVPQSTRQLLRYAQELLEVDDISNTKKYALKCIENIESAVKEFEREKKEQERKERELNLEQLKNEAIDPINTAKLSLEKVKKLGIPELHNAEHLLATAQSSFDAQKYAEAKEFAYKCKENIDLVLEEHEKQKAKQKELERLRKDAVDTTKDAGFSLEKAKKLGIKIQQNEERLLVTAQSFLDDKDYTDAINEAWKCKKGLERLIEECKPEIILKLPQRMQYNIWKYHDIIITNNGTAHAKNISINFSKSLEIRDVKNIPQIDTGKQYTLHINIKPTEAGDVPIDYTIKFSDLQDRTYELKHTAIIQTGISRIDAAENKTDYGSYELDIKRGYEVLPNNDLNFGIRVENNSNFAVMDVTTIIDYPKNLFLMNESDIQNLNNIIPVGKRTAKYILKPLGCIHNEQINALVTYKDHTGKKQTLHMCPKEVHCLCPFLKEKHINEGEYSRLAAGSEFVQEGISFKGINVEELAKFMGETCRHMLYKVREYDIEGKKVIYLSGESVGEKTYYLLTAVIQDYKGLTQVVLRAHSDKKYGLNGFMNEMADSLRHLVGSVQSAKEIGIIENTQVINIIDSVVQRTNFNMGEGGNAKVNIKDSVVQRSNIGENRGEKY